MQSKVDFTVSAFAKDSANMIKLYDCDRGCEVLLESDLYFSFDGPNLLLPLGH